MASQPSPSSLPKAHEAPLLKTFLRTLLEQEGDAAEHLLDTWDWSMQVPDVLWQATSAGKGKAPYLNPYLRHLSLFDVLEEMETLTEERALTLLTPTRILNPTQFAAQASLRTLAAHSASLPYVADTWTRCLHLALKRGWFHAAQAWLAWEVPDKQERLSVSMGHLRFSGHNSKKADTFPFLLEALLTAPGGLEEKRTFWKAFQKHVGIEEGQQREDDLVRVFKALLQRAEEKPGVLHGWFDVAERIPELLSYAVAQRLWPALGLKKQEIRGYWRDKTRTAAMGADWRVARLEYWCTTLFQFRFRKTPEKFPFPDTPYPPTLLSLTLLTHFLKTPPPGVGKKALDTLSTLLSHVTPFHNLQVGRLDSRNRDKTDALGPLSQARRLEEELKALKKSHQQTPFSEQERVVYLTLLLVLKTWSGDVLPFHTKLVSALTSSSAHPPLLAPVPAPEEFALLLFLLKPGCPDHEAWLGQYWTALERHSTPQERQAILRRAGNEIIPDAFHKNPIFSEAEHHTTFLLCIKAWQQSDPALTHTALKERLEEMGYPETYWGTRVHQHMESLLLKEAMPQEEKHSLVTRPRV